MSQPTYTPPQPRLPDPGQSERGPHLPSPMRPPEHAHKGSIGRALFVAVSAVALFGVGAAVGASGDSSTPTPAPLPAATVTTTAPPTVATPQSCLDALDEAEASFRIVQKVLTAAQHALVAVSEFDADGINAQTAKVRKYNRQLDPILTSYKADSDACRS